MFAGRVTSPANTRRSPNVDLMLTRHLRRQPTINPAFGERLVFAGISQVKSSYLGAPNHFRKLGSLYFNYFLLVNQNGILRRNHAV